MSARLRGRRILLTGGGSGIGRAVVERYIGDGALVTVLERSEEHAAELRRTGHDRLRVVVGDATDPDCLVEALTEAVDGEDTLHNLTCCVGVFDYYADITELSPTELEAAADEVWRLNVLSHLLAVSTTADALRRGQGSITLTLSESAFYPVGGGVLYGSAKWALRGMVAHLAAQLAPDVRVNGVAPGGTGGTRFAGLASLRQDQTADRVVGRDERIAQGTLLHLTPQPTDHVAAYSYLADAEGARVVTGTIINTDGGRRQ